VKEPSIRIRRLPERGTEDVAALHEILDEALVAHVGFVRDGYSVVVPVLHARVGDELLLHGSPAAGFVRAARSGQVLCVTVTLVDGLVLARSAFHHSANYRSAVVFGEARSVKEADKSAALDAFVDKVVPDRRQSLRPMTDEEAQKTEIVALALERWSVKVREGMPEDEDADYELPIWAGLLPLRLAPGDAQSDPRNLPGVEVPEHVVAWQRAPG
jgi:nitroimidazol reductase NimA-like FMN-containing flavoprotein (pyridoxamine 5'-phosphate oxidase superfamily)